jgi:hypothetical protein
MGKSLILIEIYRQVGQRGTMGGSRWVGGKSFKSHETEWGQGKNKIPKLKKQKSRGKKN